MKPEELAATPPARLPFPVTRALSEPIRAEGDGMPTLTGHFATFGDWYEVDSVFEGHFLESIDPRAFDQTIAENRSNMKVLYDHGQDPQIGNKILGPIEDLSTDSQGPAYTVPLLDTTYNRDLAPGLKAGLYGSSFRFNVEADEWDQHPTQSDYNPQAIPERRITRAHVMEFGPVTFPANPSATAGVRSTTDTYYKRSRDPEQYESLMRSAQVARKGKSLQRSLDDLAKFLLADKAALQTAIDKLANGDPLLAQEAELLEAAIEHLEPPDADEDDMSMNARPKAGATRTQPTERKATVEYVTREDKAARAAELEQALTRQATEYPGVLPESAQAQWDADTAELGKLNADIRAWDDRTALLRSFAQKEGNREYTAPTIIARKSESDIYEPAQYGGGQVRSIEERHQKLRDNAMRSVEVARFDHPALTGKEAEIRGHIAKMLDTKDEPTDENPDHELARRVLGTGNPVYKRYFIKKVQGREPTQEERYAALQVVGTTTTGGDAIPYTFDPTFIPTGAFTNINPYRQICRVEQIVGSNNWQGVSVGAVLAAYDGESAATTEGGPTFARPTITAQRASAFVTLSRETLQDRPDIGSELAVLIGEAKDTLEENQFSIGVGTTVYPLGMFVKSTFTVKETITDNVFAVADLDATEAALPIRHRHDAVWMLSRAVIRICQGFETVNGKLFNSRLGYPAVGNIANDPYGNTGMSLLGYPVWETPSAPATVTSDDTIVGILVAPKNYLILDRVGMEVEIVPNMFDATTGFPNGNRGLLAIWRNTADTVNADAGRQININ